MKVGTVLVRVTSHYNSPEWGYLTKGKTYQVMDRAYYGASRWLGNDETCVVGRTTDTRLRSDCVMLLDDKGKIGMFGLTNFREIVK